MKCVICGGEADRVVSGYSVCSKHTDEEIWDWGASQVDKLLDDDEEKEVMPVTQPCVGRR